jgi:fibronectin-binding autotransporter adhesin
MSMMNMNHDDSHITVRAGGHIIGQFDIGAVGTIHFNGLAGDDTFVVDPGITAEVIADGGAGNDNLFGGSGNNILIGGPGNDLIVGGGSRDILIAGDGLDRLFGMGNDDILVGGSTAFDSDQASLQQTLNVWNSNSSFNDRVAAIRAGTNGVPKLDATTVTDDGLRDMLIGGRGLDWFFSMSPDRIVGKTSIEQVN